MPGIVGLITKLPRTQAEAELRRMVDAIRHESFYITGTWVDETLGVYVGWAARKGSFAEKMPLRNETGDHVLIFAGEEYPDPGLPAKLKERGHQLDAEGPSYLVHLAEEDPKFPDQVNGRFHGLLVNQRDRTVALFNDRYGIQRLYYHQSKDAFYFSAESKAILGLRPELRKIDQRGLGEYLVCGCSLENRTIFDGISVLPPGSKWIFRNGALDRKGEYFQPAEWESQEPLDAETSYQELRGIFSEILPRYFAGEKAGVSLTGGLDSRMIMAWQKAAPGTLPCYSFGSIYRDCQDVILARRTAKICDQPHHVIEVGNEFLTRFPHFATRTVFLTDGCVDVKQAPDLYVNEIVAKIAPARMTGNYGSEVLRGNRAFKPVLPAAGLYQPELQPHLQAAKQTYACVLNGHPLSFGVFRQLPWHHYGLLALEQTQLALRSPFLDNALVKAAFRAPQSTLTGNDVSLRLIADGDPRLRQIRTDRGVGGNHGPLLSAIIHESLEFMFKAEYAYDYGMPQWVSQTDHFFAPLHLERLFLGRHKFYHFRIWYRNALSKFVQEILLDPRALSRPFVERRKLEAVVKGHITGGLNYTQEIHKLLTLELTHRMFLDIPAQTA